jgi:hypothetical protein
MDDSTWRNKEQGINNYSPIFLKSIVNVKIPSKIRLYHPKTFVSGHLYRKISLDQV